MNVINVVDSIQNDAVVAYFKLQNFHGGPEGHQQKAK